MDMVGGSEGQVEGSMETYTLPCVKQTASEGTYSVTQRGSDQRSVTTCGGWDGVGGWEGEVPEGGAIHVPVADSW